MQKLESQYSPAPHEDLDPEAPETAVVPIEFDGQRLDAIAAQLFHAHSRARLKVWIEAGRLRLNDVVCVLPRQPVRVGDILSFFSKVERIGRKLKRFGRIFGKQQHMLGIAMAGIRTDEQVRLLRARRHAG